MAKYYVQSGSLQTIIAAEDIEQAALLVLHKAMQHILGAYYDAELTEDDRCELVILQGLMTLGNSIRLSEQGFDRSDAIDLDMFDTLIEWHQLMTGIVRMETKYVSESAPNANSDSTESQ